MADTKNFIVLGTPRSGTTFFCKTLAECSNIWIPKFPNYEPFNPINIVPVSNALHASTFDVDAVIEKFLYFKQKQNFEYFGFKTFLTYHSDISALINTHNFDLFVVLRKNIWKVLCSQLVAMDNKDYQGSSKRFTPFCYDHSNREQRRLFNMFNALCKDYWWSENVGGKHANLIDKIYLEDLILPNASFQKVSGYFNQKLTFSADYTEDSIDAYIENFTDLKEYILSMVHKAKYHYQTLPDYLLTELEL
jgi:hypothetical protein